MNKKSAISIIIVMLVMFPAVLTNAQDASPYSFTTLITITSSTDPSILVGSSRSCTWSMIRKDSVLTVQSEGYSDLTGVVDGTMILLTDTGNVYDETGVIVGSYQDIFRAMGSFLEGFTGTATGISRSVKGDKIYCYESRILLSR